MSPLHTSKHSVGLAVLAVVLLFTPSALADEIIWDNGAPNLTGMWQSTDCEKYPHPDGVLSELLAVDLFYAPPEFFDPSPYHGSGYLTGIHWWGYEILPAGTPDPVSASNFYMYIMAYDFIPEVSLAVQPEVLFTGQSILLEDGMEAFLFEYDLPGSFGLFNYFGPGDSSPWFLILYAQGDCNWAWAESDGYDGTHWSLIPNYGWRSPGDLAFYLTGNLYSPVVPEPATLSLLGLGLGGLALRLRRRRT